MRFIDNSVIEGVFIEESKNRFIGKVLVEGSIIECYISSSSRLESIINLKNKRVLLSKTHGTARRTNYTLFAVFYRNKLIILNLGLVNKLFESIIKEGQYNEYLGFSSIIRETEIEGYKADLLLIGDEKVVIENKAIVGVRKTALAPTIYSERTISQLNKLNLLLLKGYRVFYNFIALSPFINTINVNSNEREYYSALLQCIENGLQVNGYNLYFDKTDLKSRRIQVSI